MPFDPVQGLQSKSGDPQAPRRQASVLQLRATFRRQIQAAGGDFEKVARPARDTVARDVYDEVVADIRGEFNPRAWLWNETDLPPVPWQAARVTQAYVVLVDEFLEELESGAPVERAWPRKGTLARKALEEARAEAAAPQP